MKPAPGCISDCISTDYYITLDSLIRIYVKTGIVSIRYLLGATCEPVVPTGSELVVSLCRF